jgi:hypothetical protein
MDHKETGNCIRNSRDGEKIFEKVYGRSAVQKVPRFLRNLKVCTRYKNPTTEPPLEPVERRTKAQIIFP